MRVLCVCLGFGLLACAPNGQAARPTTPSFPVVRGSVSPFYVHADGGFGTPEGLIGGGFGATPTSWSSAELGAGVSTSGVQAALMLGLRLHVAEATTLGISSGLSVGRYTASASWLSDWPFEKVWTWALWSNTELTIRHELDERTAVRFHIGVAASIAASTNPTCKPADNDSCLRDPVPDLTPYLGVGIEHHF
jgi:hypothetical protein